MLGLIFGAGMFAMPAAVARAGTLWGVLHFFIAFFLMLILQFWFAEIAFAADRQERFTGFARRWVGRRGEWVAFFSVLVGYYGALLAYGVLGGIFLHALFPFFSSFWWSFIFFGIAGILLFFDFRRIGTINFYLSIPLVLFVILLSGIALPSVDFSYLVEKGMPAFWFIPYGIFIFAFGGLATIPEVSDIMKPLGASSLRMVVAISMIISALVYAFFIIAVVGVTGSATTDDALTGLAAVLGGKIIVLGALIGFLAVFTSHIALGADMKNIFRFDYRVAHILSWAGTVFPPFFLFLLGLSQFLSIISFVGAVAFGVSGILIFYMIRNFHKINPAHVHSFLSPAHPFAFLVFFFLLMGVFVELLNVSGVL